MIAGGGAPPPTALAALVTPERPWAQVPGSLGGLTFLLTRLSWKVPLAVLGRWCGVHKTTIVRGVLGLALALWPLIYRWRGERVNASRVYAEEKWLKSRGRWSSGGVIVEVPTELPGLAARRPSRGSWACRWVGRPWRQRNKVPTGLSTEGVPASASLVAGATHVWCRLHHQQGVTHGLTPPVAPEAELDARKPALTRLFQTRDQRTGRRRLMRRTERAAAAGLTPWVSAVEAKRPPRISRVGRVRRPSTANAVARFCRSCQRFYCTRGGVHAGLRAKRELLLFLVVYLCTPHATPGHAPIEVIVSEARSRPLYRVINDPFRALQERAAVTPEASMADFLRPQAAGA